MHATATHKQRQIPPNFHRFLMWLHHKGRRELVSQGYVDHFSWICLCWEEGGREEFSCAQGLCQALSEGTHSCSGHWPAITSYLSQRAAAPVSLVHRQTCSAMLHCTCRNTPFCAPDVGTELKQGTNWVCGFDEKYNSRGEGLALLAWQGEMFVTRVGLVTVFWVPAQ